jgi:hypothetical protein
MGAFAVSPDDVEFGMHIVRRRDDLLVKRERLLRIIMAAEEYAAELDRTLAVCAESGGMIGMRVPLPDWDNVRKTSLLDEMTRVDGIAAQFPVPKGDSISRENIYYDLISELVQRIEKLRERAAKPPRSTLRKIALDRLAMAGSQGTKADAIRHYAKMCMDGGFHPKSVSMTLNRLAKEGQARRDGRLWFHISAKAEAPAEPPASDNEAGKPKAVSMDDFSLESVERGPPVAPEDLILMEVYSRLSKVRGYNPFVDSA